MFTLTSLIAITGVGLVVITAYPCFVRYARTHGNTSMNEAVALSIIGVLGYGSVIGVSLLKMTGLTLILASVALAFTAYLIVKTLRTRFGCPLCPVVWIINFMMFFAAIWDFMAASNN